jgi:C1A family cysteine protease
MKKFLLGILGLFFSLSLVMNDNAFSDEIYSIMHPDLETIIRWKENYERAPKAPVNEAIHVRLAQAEVQGAGTSLSLLNYLQYTPSERSQGSCGNCWVWAGTGVSEIALSSQNGIKDRSSIQFLDSCKTDEFACCGGDLTEFASWYRSKGFSIPWSNTNASFQDSSRQCSYASSAVSCGSISTNPRYPITSIQTQTIQTTGISQDTAIANIKNVLNQNKGIYFAFCLANNTDWNAFFSFWSNQTETAIWNPDPYCGHTWVNGQGGCHGVLIVGYNDEGDIANRYWIVLNSWGTAGGRRLNGLFRLKMYMNYGCTLTWPVIGPQYSNEFMTLNMQFNVGNQGTIQVF